MPLNYNDVQGIYRNEKNAPALQHVGENFYRELQEFLSQLEEEHREYMGKLVDEIMERRRNKVLMQAMRTADSPPLNATPEEVKLYGETVRVLERYREGLGQVHAEETVEPEKEEPVEHEGGMANIRIIKPIPAIMGVDSKQYGPFEEGQEVEIPRETAEILLGKEIAEEV